MEEAVEFTEGIFEGDIASLEGGDFIAGPGGEGDDVVGGAVDIGFGLGEFGESEAIIEFGGDFLEIVDLLERGGVIPGERGGGGEDEGQGEEAQDGWRLGFHTLGWAISRLGNSG